MSKDTAMEMMDELKAAIPEMEHRYSAGEIEIREGKSFGIRGYIPFDSESQSTTFRERINPKAFDKTVRDGKNDIVSSWNHDPNWVLGRRSNDSLKLGITDTALEYEVTLDEDDAMHRHFARRIERRDVIGSSFTFRTVRDAWSDDDEDDMPLRELVEVKLYELGPVTYPFYQESGAQLRSWAQCDAASVRCGNGELDLSELAAAICRSRNGKLQTWDDIEIVRTWLGRLIDYMPREDVTNRAELKLRISQLRRLSARYGLG